MKAWDAFFASGALPGNNGDCDNPLAATGELGQKMKVTATPTLVFADGSVVPGALPAQRLEAEIKQGEAEAARLAAARSSRPLARSGASARSLRTSPQRIDTRWRSSTSSKSSSSTSSSGRTIRATRCRSGFPTRTREIKNGAQLIVRESQVAQFVYLGEFGDTFGPGKHTLTTDNIPILTNLKSWKYALESPFKADVYYVVTRVFHRQQVGHGESRDDARRGLRRRARCARTAPTISASSTRRSS